MLIEVSLKRNKLFICPILLWLCFSCNSEKIPQIIKDHNIYQEYVDSKFLIYCWHLIDESSLVGGGITTSKNPLQFIDCIIQNGELKELLFTWSELDNKIANSILFEERKIIGLGTKTGIVDISSLNLVEDNKYTRTLKEKYRRFGEKMNPWLKKEFKKRNLVP